MKRLTEAMVLFELGKPLRMLEIELPPLAPGQVLVDIAYSGVCGSQVLEAMGGRGPDRFLPHTLGHEGSGIVVEVGTEVKKVKPGDTVVLSWLKGAGAEVLATVYQSAEGKINSGAISTFMRRTVTCENRVTPIPREMPLREAALLGCAFPTGAGIVFNTAKVAPGRSVAVFGLGGVGLSAVVAAGAARAQTLVAVDVAEPKLNLAKKLGATHLINATLQDPVEAINELTNGQGVDYSIEAVGKREAMEAAFQVVHAPGGVCVLAGNLPQGGRVSIDPFDLIKGKRILGSWGGETVPDRDIPMYVRLCLEGRLRLGDMIGREYRLEQVNQALDDLESGLVQGRGLINTSDNESASAIGLIS